MPAVRLGRRPHEAAEAGRAGRVGVGVCFCLYGYGGRVKLTLPFPPSVNNLYPTGSHGKRFKSTEGKRFDRAVANACGNMELECYPRKVRLQVTINQYQPKELD